MSGQTEESAHAKAKQRVAVLSAGSTLNPINSSIISVALTPILLAFGEGQVSAGWLISGLYVATAVGQPTWGHLADLYDSRNVYVFGLGVVAVSGVVGATASSFPVLVCARVGIGLGTAAAYPTAMVLLRDLSDVARRRGTAWLTIAGQVTLAIGPPIGGALTSGLGWRSLFLINTPIALACAAAALAWIPRVPHPTRKESAARPDLIGIVLLAAVLVAGVSYAQTLAPGWAVCGIAALVLLILRETRCDDPVLDIRQITKDYRLTLIYVRHALTFLVHYSFLYGWTQWLESSRGYDPAQAGAFLLVSFAVAAVVARLAASRRDQTVAVSLGLIGTLGAALLVLCTTPTTSVWTLVVTSALFGLPEGLLSVGHQLQISEIATGPIGSLSGLLRTAMYVGAIGSGVLVGHSADPSASDAMVSLGVPMVAVSAAAVILAVPDLVNWRRKSTCAYSSAGQEKT